MNRLFGISILCVGSLVAACSAPLYDGDGDNAPVQPDADVPDLADASASGSEAQRSYTYPGCPNEDWIFPRANTFRCAKRTITERHAGCSVATDCVEVELVGDCVGDCHPALVNSEDVATFEAEIQTEIARYCEGSPFQSAWQCPAGAIPDCIDQLCTWAYPPDAGL